MEDIAVGLVAAVGRLLVWIFVEVLFDFGWKAFKVITGITYSQLIIERLTRRPGLSSNQEGALAVLGVLLGVGLAAAQALLVLVVVGGFLAAAGLTVGAALLS